ncbi:MAG TPA: hypothetical protein PK961_06845 [bacterium]|nr:hypothetical protein [bacterium]
MKTQMLIGLFLLVMTVGLFACADDDDDNDDDTPADDDAVDDDSNLDDDTAVDDDDDDEPTLYAGAARVDVTPTKDLILGGYGMCVLAEIFCRWSDGVHDPLYANAVAIEDANGTAVVQIAIDSVGMVYTHLEMIQNGVADATGIPPDHVIVSTSHSHQAPDTIGMWGVMIPPIPGRDPEYMAQVITGAIEAGVTAYDSRRPALARVNFGYEPNYHFNFLWDKDPDAVTDSTMTVMGLYEPDGTPIATMMNWGSHPTVLPPENLLIGADFVGGYYEAMAAALPGIHVFLQGNLGASVRTYNFLDPWDEKIGDQVWGTWEDAWGVGAGLAETALSLLDAAVPVDDTEIHVAKATINVQLMNPFFAIVGKLDMIPRPVPNMGEYADSRVSAWRMGPFSLATAPGETAPKLGLELRGLMDGEYKMIVNMAQDWVGYLMYPEMFTSLIYIEYSMVCPGGQTAQAMVDAYTAIFSDPNF